MGRRPDVIITHPSHPPALATSQLVYAAPTWSFFNTAAEAVTTFPDGSNRNRLRATGTTSDYHTLQRAWPVTAGRSYTLSVVGQADAVSTWLGFEFYNGSTFLASAGRFNPTTGQTGGFGPGTLTDLGGGLYRYDKVYTIPSGVTNLTTRLLVADSTGSSLYVPAGQALFVSGLTLTLL